LRRPERRRPWQPAAEKHDEYWKSSIAYPNFHGRAAALEKTSVFLLLGSFAGAVGVPQTQPAEGGGPEHGTPQLYA
jgi:hypothetical protein